MGTIASERLKMSNLTNAPLFAHQRCSKQRHIGDTPLLCTLYHFIGGYFLAHCGGEFGIGSDEGVTTFHSGSKEPPPQVHYTDSR